MIGLPLDETARLRPTDLEKYAVFVQSTSVNRVLQGGTRFLYEVEDWDREGDTAETSAGGADEARQDGRCACSRLGHRNEDCKAAGAVAMSKASVALLTPAGPASGRRRFEFVEGSSNKFWEVWVEGSNVFTQYGRIDSKGQTTIKDYSDDVAARKAADKLIAEKTGKGYVEKNMIRREMARRRRMGYPVATRGATGTESGADIQHHAEADVVAAEVRRRTSAAVPRGTGGRCCSTNRRAAPGAYPACTNRRTTPRRCRACRTDPSVGGEVPTAVVLRRNGPQLGVATRPAAVEVRLGSRTSVAPSGTASPSPPGRRTPTPPRSAGGRRRPASSRRHGRQLAAERGRLVPSDLLDGVVGAPTVLFVEMSRVVLHDRHVRFLRHGVAAR